MNMLFSAFAAADLTNFATVLAQGDVNSPKVFSASSTFRPLTKSKMGLSRFCDAPTPLANALTGGTGYLTLVARSDRPPTWPR